jgi:hypothetical protein
MKNTRVIEMYSWLVENKWEIDMPTDTIIVTAFVAGVIAIFSLALVYGERQTESRRREHPPA